MSEPVANPATVAEPNPAKTFTQEEVDALVGKRLAKAMKGIPSEEELKAFREWKSGQQTEQERWQKLTEENEANKTALADAKAELEQNRREKFLIAQGVSADDVDYYSYKIGKMVTDELTFEKAAEQYLGEKKQTPKVRVDLAAPVNGGSNPNTANETMNALIRGAMK